MKYFKYIIKIILYSFIEFISLFYTLFILPYRYKAREVVYNFYLETNKFNYLISCVSKLNKMKNYDKRILTRTEIVVSLKEHIKFNFYFWFIWIWLDDLATADFIREDKLYNSKVFKKKIMHDIQNIKNNTDNCPLNNEDYLKNNKHVNVSLWTAYINILANTNNNFANTFFYTLNKTDIFLVNIFGREFGWVEDKTYYFGTVYKLVFFK